MGIVPQVPSENGIVTNLGLNKITSNWAFLLVLFQFLTCLGLITIKRITQFNVGNIGFILNHLGLFLALTAGMLGTGDLQRLSLNTYENKHSWIATDANNNIVELPFAIYLNDFLIEEYNPKLALVVAVSFSTIEFIPSIVVISYSFLFVLLCVYFPKKLVFNFLLKVSAS